MKYRKPLEDRNLIVTWTRHQNEIKVVTMRFINRYKYLKVMERAATRAPNQKRALKSVVVSRISMKVVVANTVIPQEIDLNSYLRKENLPQ